MPASVLVAGDLNLDLVLTGDVVPRFGQVEQLLDAGELVLGGSAAIAACGLARLGVPTRFVARVGDDAFGRIALDALGAAGVDIAAVEVDRSVPTGISVILSAAGDRAILTVPGTIPTLTAAAVLGAARGAAHLHVASYFLQPTLAAALPAVLGGIRSTGTTVSLDTNWDPAEQWAGLDGVLPLVDVLLPNLEELRAIARAVRGGSAVSRCSRPASQVAESAASDLDRVSAEEIAGLGPRVVVKAGADGGWSVGAGSDRVTVAGLRVDVADTTGAGDSFDAGYLAARSYGIRDEHERLRWATAAGSLSTRAVGGTGAQPTLDELVESLR